MQNGTAYPTGYYFSLASYWKKPAREVVPAAFIVAQSGTGQFVSPSSEGNTWGAIQDHLVITQDLHLTLRTHGAPYRIT